MISCSCCDAAEDELDDDCHHVADRAISCLWYALGGGHVFHVQEFDMSSGREDSTSQGPSTGQLPQIRPARRKCLEARAHSVRRAYGFALPKAQFFPKPQWLATEPTQVVRSRLSHISARQEGNAVEKALGTMYPEPRTVNW